MGQLGDLIERCDAVLSDAAPGTEIGNILGDYYSDIRSRSRSSLGAS